MRERTAEMDAARASAQGTISRREAKNSFHKAAADMMYYVARMKAEIPLFRDTLQKGADAAAQAALISATLDSTDRNPARAARQTLVDFLDALNAGYNGTESFKNTVQGLPRMTSVLNQAKRETATVLQDQLDGMAEGRRIVTETIRTLDGIIGEQAQSDDLSPK